MTSEELKKIVDNHRHWLNQDCEGWKDMRAELYATDLHGCDLSSVNLSYAGLRHVNFMGAHLQGAILYGADLCGANLNDASLYGADLRTAVLDSTILTGTNFCGADLKGAYIDRALMLGANLSQAKNVPYIPMVCPEEGEFIAWKRGVGSLIKLRIPEDAKRCSGTGRKCRCDKAIVEAIYNLDGTESDTQIARSLFNHYFIYEVGKEISVENFCENRWEECADGIHFFINRQEALQYV